MNVLVVGGTGFLGKHLCRELRERGHDVTALSRSPDDGTLPEGVETIAGDVTAYDSIETAFEGKDVVVNLVALSPLFRPRGGEETHFTVHRDGTENVVRAAEAHDVRRIVQMSALDADPDGPTAFIQSKGLAEKLVRDSDLEWVIFRPSVVFGDGGEFIPYTKQLAPPYFTPLPGGGKTRFQPIWVGDLARILADAIESSGPDDPHVSEVYEIGGPEILTLAEIAKLAHAVDGRPVGIVSIPMGLAGLGLKSLEYVPVSILDSLPGIPRMGADQYRSLRFDNTVDENDIAAFGIDQADLRTLSTYLNVEHPHKDA